MMATENRGDRLYLLFVAILYQCKCTQTSKSYAHMLELKLQALHVTSLPLSKKWQTYGDYMRNNSL